MTGWLLFCLAGVSVGGALGVLCLECVFVGQPQAAVACFLMAVGVTYRATRSIIEVIK